MQCCVCSARPIAAVIMAVEGAPVIDWKKATQGKVFYKVPSHSAMRYECRVAERSN